MHSKSDTLAPVGVVGAGRLGTALDRALRAARCPVVGPTARGEVPRGCRAIVLCVPDAEIPAAAATVAGAAALIGHTSGATRLAALEAAEHAGAAVFGWHPLQTFAPGAHAHDVDGSPRRTGGGDRAVPQAPTRPDGSVAIDAHEPPSPFAGAGCGVAGSAPEALAFARELALLLGMTPFEIDDAGRAAYHAAASIASNFLVTLMAAAEEVAAGAGLEPSEARALLAPLIRRSVENTAALGPERALTGPVARGDDETVAAQRSAVGQTAPALLPLFDELVEQTQRLAGRRVLA